MRQCLGEITDILATESFSRRILRPVSMWNFPFSIACAEPFSIIAWVSSGRSTRSKSAVSTFRKRTWKARVAEPQSPMRAVLPCAFFITFRWMSP